MEGGCEIRREAGAEKENGGNVGRVIQLLLLDNAYELRDAFGAAISACGLISQRPSIICQRAKSSLKACRGVKNQ